MKQISYMSICWFVLRNFKHSLMHGYGTHAAKYYVNLHHSQSLKSAG